jgi:acyl-CoA synthetase (AMP-forming)/AMP-acid ligase II
MNCLLFLLVAMLLLPNKQSAITPHSAVLLGLTSPEPKSYLSLIFAGSHQDVVPAVLPFFHLYGMSFLILGRLAHGCKIVTLPKFEPKSFFKMLDQHQVLLFPFNISTACLHQEYKYLFLLSFETI